MLSFKIVKMFAKKCARKIVNCYRMFAELRDALAGGWVLDLKGPSQPPPFSMPSKLLIKHGETNSYCFTVSCDPEGMFNCRE